MILFCRFDHHLRNDPLPEILRVPLEQMVLRIKVLLLILLLLLLLLLFVVCLFIVYFFRSCRSSRTSAWNPSWGR